jgi:cytidylate kinase
MQAITISREYGSGGGEIAARLARKLNWQLIDHGVIEQAARELGVYETEVARHDDEYVEGTLSRILNRIRNLTITPLSASTVGTLTPLGAPLVTSSSTVDRPAYQDMIHHVVRAAANTGHVVIVGRGGQFLLADRRDVLHIRIVAPLELRVLYVAQREGLDAAAARTRVQEKDRARDRNMQSQFHRKADDPHLYDLVINTAVLDLDRVVDLICQALEDKASRLGVPKEQLGPAAGLAAYPTKPADFRVQEKSSK